MPEWTLCADQKVYAGLRVVAKPATHRTLCRCRSPGPGSR